MQQENASEQNFFSLRLMTFARQSDELGLGQAEKQAGPC